MAALRVIAPASIDRGSILNRQFVRVEEIDSHSVSSRDGITNCYWFQMCVIYKIQTKTMYGTCEFG